MRLELKRPTAGGPSQERSDLPRTVAELFPYLARVLNWGTDVMAAVEPAFMRVEGENKRTIEVTAAQIRKLTDRLTLSDSDRPLDGQTKLWLKESFDDILTHLIFEEKHLRQVGIIYFDVWKFKEYNDSDPSRQLGDVVIEELGNIIRTNLRMGDRAFRYGGDEFAILINDPENIEAMLEVARHIDYRVISHPWDNFDSRYSLHLPRVNLCALFLVLPSEEERQILKAAPERISAVSQEVVTVLNLLNNIVKGERNKGSVVIDARYGTVVNGRLVDHAGDRLLDSLPVIVVPR